MNNLQESKIFFENLKHLGIDPLKFYVDSGSQIAKLLSEEYGKDRSIGIICGLGGNGLDGLSIASSLYESGIRNITVYIAGRIIDSNIELFKKVANHLKDNTSLKVKQDINSQDVIQHNVNLECLVGTGLDGEKLNKRFKNIIDSISHFESSVIAIDLPCPHYKPDKTYSIQYPKTTDATTIKTSFPNELISFCGPGEREYLWKPNKHSHKSKNGNLIFIDDKRVLNAEILNDYQVNFNKYDSSNLNSNKFDDDITTADVILIGDLESTYTNESLVKRIAKDADLLNRKKLIIFGNSLDLILEYPKGSVLIVDSDTRDLLPEDLYKFVIENHIFIASIGSYVGLYKANGERKLLYNQKTFEDNYFIDYVSRAASFATKNSAWLCLRAGVEVGG